MKLTNIIVKVPHEDHKRILEKVGATEVVTPEREMAAKVARSLICPKVMDYIRLTNEYTICEIAPPASSIGRSSAEIQLRKKHNIGLLASRDVLTDEITLIPGGEFVVKDSDVLVVIGKEKDIQRMT
jgi:trk system potassium uptake protein